MNSADIFTGCIQCVEQVCFSIGIICKKWSLRACDDNGYGAAVHHSVKYGGGVCHGIRAVGDDYSVKAPTNRFIGGDAYVPDIIAGYFGAVYVHKLLRAYVFGSKTQHIKHLFHLLI